MMDNMANVFFDALGNYGTVAAVAFTGFCLTIGCVFEDDDEQEQKK